MSIFIIFSLVENVDFWTSIIHFNGISKWFIEIKKSFHRQTDEPQTKIHNFNYLLNR